jgi:RNA polymerase sigma-70 factor (ECF subfamily)
VNAENFSALYDQTARDLLAYLLRRAQNPEDAADCLAETFLIAWTKRDQIPSDQSQARPWLFGVARNVVRRGRELDNSTSEAVAALARELRDIQTPVPTDDPIGLALGLLSPIDREIIEMLAWDGLAPREVAAILDLSPNVVRIRAHRARLKLREQLRSQDPVRHRTS